MKNEQFLLYNLQNWRELAETTGDCHRDKFLFAGQPLLELNRNDAEKTVKSGLMRHQLLVFTCIKVGI